MHSKREEKVLILDFGSQYTQLIARRTREQKVYCEIVPFDTTAEEIARHRPLGLILSGGPASVYTAGAPLPGRDLFSLDLPVLGICYGLQLMGHMLDGEVKKAESREYGKASLYIDDHEDLFKGIDTNIQVWMSHGDQLTRLPTGFVRLGHTDNTPIAAVADRKRHIYGLQFHPEVVHTPEGGKILGNFLFRICGCKGQWTPEHFIEASIKRIRETAGRKKILCGLSGGVDSAVVAYLIHEAVGDQLVSVFVDNGLLRANEAGEVMEAFSRFPVRFVDAPKEFLRDLKGITDPEKKRRVIGQRFIQVFEKEAEKAGKIDFLAQGTLYPDVIESTGKGPSATIKSHHNVGGLPEKMKLKLIEPLREIFKDEVRVVGKVLGVPDSILCRHPFPGPGLAVRIIGEVTQDRLDVLRQADGIFIRILKETGWYDRVWQALTVLLPVRSVGVMGDERTYECVAALRAITSLDGMTADWAKLPYEVLNEAAGRITNEVRGINRVVYDISSKPPSTIEWE